MGLRTCAAHAVSDNALSAAGLRVEQSALHRCMRFSVLERLDALPMVDLCRVEQTKQENGQREKQEAESNEKGSQWRSTWRDGGER